MIKYLKLQLDKCSFWQKDDNLTNPAYIIKEYVNKPHECLNNLFFKVDNNVLQELFTGKKLNATISDNQISVKNVLGIEISNGAFSYVTPSIIAKNYYQLQDANLKEEYLNIINDVLVNSPKCDQKDFNDKIFSLKFIKKNK